jgi:hypothetical protein
MQEIIPTVEVLFIHEAGKPCGRTRLLIQELALLAAGNPNVTNYIAQNIRKSLHNVGKYKIRTTPAGLAQMKAAGFGVKRPIIIDV